MNSTSTKEAVFVCLFVCLFVCFGFPLLESSPHNSQDKTVWNWMNIILTFVSSGLKMFLLEVCRLVFTRLNNLSTVRRIRLRGGFGIFSLYIEVIQLGKKVNSDTTVFFKPYTHSKRENVEGRNSCKISTLASPQAPHWAHLMTLTCLPISLWEVTTDPAALIVLD